MELNDKLKIKIGIIVVLVVITGLILIGLNFKEEETLINYEELENTTEVLKTDSKEYIYVDIKGAVKKPGVYQLESGSIVEDVIKEAGGLKKNAYTKNINLAQILKNEMVIYIFTSSEIKKSTTTQIITDTECKCEVIEVNNCIEATTKVSSNGTSNSSLVNINTASLEELMTVSGIGESKAKAIIEYRENNKFTTIEDIKNVSGIGESLFAKIKDYITV